jgi:protein-disulfide isomerase
MQVPMSANTNKPGSTRPPAPKSKGMKVQRTAAPPPKRSPVLLASIAAIAAGALLIGVLAVTGGLVGGGSNTAIATPAIGTPVELADGRSLGSADAPVEVEIWADYQCPVCARFTRDIEPFIVSRYVEPGKVRMTFRDFTFIGPESFDAAVAARVAQDQKDAFWPFHDLLFANQGAENKGAFNRTRLADMAVAVGLDRAAFLKAMDDPAFLAEVNAETTVGRGLGIDSTPTMVIDGQVYAGLPDLGKLETLLDGLVAAASAAPAASIAPVPASPAAAPSAP